MAKKKEKILQLKVTVEGCKPQIWRRLLVPDSFTFEDLHILLQIVFSWEECHLHEFETQDGTRIGTPDEDCTIPLLEEHRVKLGKYLKAPKDNLLYLYDFGDGWEHKVQVEKVLNKSADMTVPSCVAGKRAGPVEDSGGPHGYNHLVKVLKKPAHKDYQDMVEWIGDDLEPELLDVDAINAKINHAFAEEDSDETAQDVPYDTDKVDDMALALLYLTMSRDKYGTRAWKGLDWGITDRLFEKGYIGDPKGKAKSVVVTPEGEERAKELFNLHFIEKK